MQTQVGFFEELEKTFHTWIGHYRNERRRLDLLQYTLRLEQVASGKTDANGNLKLPIYNNTSSRRIIVGRCLVWADGYTPASTFSGAGGYLTLSSQPDNAGTIKDYAPYTSGNPFLPNVAEYSGLNGIRFDRNEGIFLQVFLGPASTNITARIYGFMEPVDTDYEI